MNRHFRRGFIGWVVLWLIPWVIAFWILDNDTVGIAATALYLGYAVGTTIGYRWGMNDQDAIITDVYGKEWRRDAAIGHHRRKREAAPWN